jgi:hypothetical protein
MSIFHSKSRKKEETAIDDYKKNIKAHEGKYNPESVEGQAFSEMSYDELQNYNSDMANYAFAKSVENTKHIGHKKKLKEARRAKQNYLNEANQRIVSKAPVLPTEGYDFNMSSDPAALSGIKPAAPAAPPVAAQVPVMPTLDEPTNPFTVKKKI